jgi:hypothetical protein
MFSTFEKVRSFHSTDLQEMRKQAQAAAAPVLEACSKLDKLDSVSTEDKAFVKQLAEYLTKRAAEIHLFTDNVQQVKERSIFIKSLVNLIWYGNVAEQKTLLQTAKIKHFQGFITQELYLLLVARRDFLESQDRSYQQHCR